MSARRYLVLIWQQAEQKLPCNCRHLTLECLQRYLPLIDWRGGLRKPRKQNLREGICRSVSPIPPRVMGGKFTKNYTHADKKFLVPSESFQRPKQSGKIVPA